MLCSFRNGVSMTNLLISLQWEQPETIAMMRKEIAEIRKSFDLETPIINEQTVNA